MQDDADFSLEPSSDDELVLSEVLANFIHVELAKEANMLQLKSATSAGYTRKKHLMSLLLSVKDKSELDEFRGLFEAPHRSTCYDQEEADTDTFSLSSSLLSDLIGADYAPVRSSASYLTKMVLRLVGESLAKCISLLDHLNDKSAVKATNGILAPVKNEKSFTPRPLSLNRCSFCNFKHFSKSVVQCHISKNHLQHLKPPRLSKTVSAMNAESASSMLDENLFNDEENIVYNNQSLTLNSSLYAEGGEEDDDHVDGQEASLNEISM